MHRHAAALRHLQTVSQKRKACHVGAGMHAVVHKHIIRICLAELRTVAPSTRIIGYVTEKLDSAIYLEA